MCARVLNTLFELEGSLCLLYESCECSLILDSDLREHLSVEVDACSLEAAHELRVVDAVCLCLSIDTSDPELSELSLLLLSADVSVVTALHYGLLSHLEVLGLCAPVTLRCLKYLISSLARHHSAFYSCHFS